MSELEPGAIVDGRYKVLRRLGAGGMADVFLVEDEQLSRKVALKLLHRRFSADPGFVERFRREAQAAASLQHPNVVGIYDRGAFDGTYYIAMEYLPGRSLKQLIRQEAPLDPLRAIDIAVQILKAARFAHRRGVIHRDLKPHNVIVDESDQAKVTDFGIARAGASDMTETGSIMGTAQYLSPEQAQGHAVSESSDLYSIGVVMYEMLTGRVPFDGESAVTIALKHVSEAPVPPSKLNPDIPPALEQAVLWALNKNPADRPADADQFITVLEQVRESIVSGSPGEITASMAAIGAGAVAGAGPGAGAPPTARTAMMPTAAAIGAYEAAGPVESERVIEEYDREPPPPPLGEGGGPWPWVIALLILLLIGGGVAAYLLTRPAKATVPTVVGDSLQVAQTLVQNAGFTPNPIYETSEKPVNQVIDQSPLGGARRDTGTTVTLTISQGPGNVTVPSITQLPEKEAERAIQRAHLKVARIVKQHSRSVPSGQAIRTDPGAGTTLTQGTGITLFVSSGPAAVQVPNVIGETEQAARADLRGAGFNVSSTSQPATGNQTVGNVIAQSPSSGSLQPGSTVSIVVAGQPPTVTVPDVVGATAQDATKQLRSAGFGVTQNLKDVTDPTQNGRVIRQSPRAGAKAKKGDTVTIVVGRVKGSSTTPTTTTTTPNLTPTTTTTTSTTP
jgi:serine/threonine-protein kinase